MTRTKTREEQQLDAYFTPESFVIEEVLPPLEDPVQAWVVQFAADKYSALFHLGFLGKANWFSSSVEFLYQVAELLIKK